MTASNRRMFGLAMLVLVALLASYVVALATISPAPAQTGDNGDDECPGATVVATLGPSTESDNTTVSVTGERFRVSYDVEIADDFIGSVDITVENESFIDGEIVTESGQGSFIVLEGPETFDLSVVVSPDDSATYTVTVEDCTGSTGGKGNTKGGETTIINVPPKPLPPTGGPAIYSIIAGSIMAGAGLLTWRLVQRERRG